LEAFPEADGPAAAPPAPEWDDEFANVSSPGEPLLAAEPVVAPAIPAAIEAIEPVVAPPVPAIAATAPIVAPSVPAAIAAAVPVAAPPVPAAIAAAEPVVAPPVPPAVAAAGPVAAAPAIFEPIPAPTPSDVLITRTLRLDAVEQYRKLGAVLHEAQQDRAMKTVLCTSALVGEGKTVTASNLALTLSESYGRRVLLIDADLRRPQIHTMFGIQNQSGLADVLAARVETKVAVHQVSDRLSVVTAGVATSDPMSGLTSGRLRQVIGEASAKFDWVVVDTPPVLLLPDARVLVSMVDAVLLVVRAGSTPYRTVLRAVDLIKRERILGTVLNSVEEPALHEEYGGYDHYYSAVKSA
jgi:capsular exopolysaccharide synthesis family protein